MPLKNIFWNALYHFFKLSYFANVLNVIKFKIKIHKTKTYPLQPVHYSAFPQAIFVSAATALSHFLQAKCLLDAGLFHQKSPNTIGWWPISSASESWYSDMLRKCPILEWLRSSEPMRQGVDHHFNCSWTLGSSELWIKSISTDCSWATEPLNYQKWTRVTRQEFKLYSASFCHKDDSYSLRNINIDNCNNRNG